MPQLLEVKPVTPENLVVPQDEQKEKVELDTQEIFQKEQKKTEEVVPKKKDRYAHLAAARAKALANRKEKAAAKKLIKAQEKEEKLRLREEKKKARQEKNRVKSRERYWELKKEKEEKKEERDNAEQRVAAPPAPPAAKQVSFAPQQNMTYDQFENYMDRYTKKRMPVRKKAPPPPQHNAELERLRSIAASYHPANYPLKGNNPYTRRNKKLNMF